MTADEIREVTHTQVGQKLNEAERLKQQALKQVMDAQKSIVQAKQSLMSIHPIAAESAPFKKLSEYEKKLIELVGELNRMKVIGS